MDKKTFIKKCIPYADKHNDGERPEYGYKTRKTLPRTTLTKFYNEWSTGGVEGGSCWDTGEEDNHHSYTSSNPPATLTGLDAFLEAEFPNISFLTYKRLEAKVKIGDYSVNEYYGNRSDYGTKSLEFEDVYEVLSSSKLLGE